MITEGYGEGLTVRWPTEISGDWATLAATASSVSSEASASAAQMEAASESWNGLASSYREPETQDIVHTALADVPQVTRQWADVAGRLSDVLQAFSTEANGLEQRSGLLREQAASLQARLLTSDLFTGSEGGETSFEDEALRRSIDAHNSDVMTLDARWSQLEQETASEIDSLSAKGGLHDEIPQLPAVGLGVPGSPQAPPDPDSSMDNFAAANFSGPGNNDVATTPGAIKGLADESDETEPDTSEDGLNHADDAMGWMDNGHESLKWLAEKTLEVNDGTKWITRFTGPLSSGLSTFTAGRDQWETDSAEDMPGFRQAYRAVIAGGAEGGGALLGGALGVKGGAALTAGLTPFIGPVAIPVGVIAVGFGAFVGGQLGQSLGRFGGQVALRAEELVWNTGENIIDFGSDVTDSSKKFQTAAAESGNRLFTDDDYALSDAGQDIHEAWNTSVDDVGDAAKDTGEAIVDDVREVGDDALDWADQKADDWGVKFW